MLRITFRHFYILVLLLKCSNQCRRVELLEVQDQYLFINRGIYQVMHCVITCC